MRDSLAHYKKTQSDYSNNSTYVNCTHVKFNFFGLMHNLCHMFDFERLLFLTLSRHTTIYYLPQQWCYSIKAFARAETVERIHSVSNGLQEMGMLEKKGFINRFEPTSRLVCIRGIGSHFILRQKRMNYQNNSILIRVF